MLHFCQWLEQLPWIMAINSSTLGAVFVELIHYISFFLLVGTTVFVDLRALGIAGRRQSLTATAEQLLPLAWFGLLFATLSGFILFAGDATAFFRADVFQFKILVILAAVVVGLLVQLQIRRSRSAPKEFAPATLLTKLLAFVSLVLWFGAILASLEVAALTGLG